MQQDGGKEREGGIKAPDAQSMARRSDFLASRIPLGSAENEPRESNFNSSTHSRAEHSGSNKSADPRVQPASASCSWGAVTSQIPASLFIPFCSGSKTPAVFTPALAGPAPGTRGGPAWWRRRRRRRRWVTAAARPPRGQCRPRAALRRPPRDRCRPPRSVAECYPVLNVTLTHSIPDTTALTSSIHAARAAIGRASRPGGAVLPLRPFITPGHRPRRRRGAGGAGGAGAPGRRGRGRRAGRRGAGQPRESPAAPWRSPARSSAWAAPPPAAAPGTSASQRRRRARSSRGTGNRPALPGPRCSGCPGRPQESRLLGFLPGTPSPAGGGECTGSWGRMLENWSSGASPRDAGGKKDFIESNRRPKGCKAFKQVPYSLHSLSPRRHPQFPKNKEEILQSRRTVAILHVCLC